MTDIKIDPVTGDLDLSSGSLELVRDEDAIAQNIRIRLQFFRGEWFLDTRQGMPYFEQILGKKLRKNIVDQIFKDALSSTPGVAKIDKFSQNYDGATRALTVAFTVVTDSGAVLVFNEAFIVGVKS